MKSLLQRHPELTVNKPKTVLNQFGKLSSSLSRTSNKLIGVISAIARNLEGN